jgi:tetratricopeptide (TPR) repeat protein
MKKKVFTVLKAVIKLTGSLLLCGALFAGCASVPTAKSANEHGEYEYARGYYGFAVSWYTDAITLDPRYSEAYRNRGLAQTELGNYEKALADYDEAIRLSPHNPIAYTNRGYTYNAMKDYDRALTACNMALGFDPQYAPAYHNRGTAYYGTGDYTRAAADFAEALKLDPNLSAAKDSLADARSRMTSDTPSRAASTPKPAAAPSRPTLPAAVQLPSWVKGGMPVEKVHTQANESWKQSSNTQYDCIIDGNVWEFHFNASGLLVAAVYFKAPSNTIINYFTVRFGKNGDRVGVDYIWDKRGIIPNVFMVGTRDIGGGYTLIRYALAH